MAIERTEKPTETISLNEQYNNTPESKKPLNGVLDGLEALQRKADIAKDEKERAERVYKIYQDNTRKSEQLLIEMYEGTKQGEDIYRLFLKACKAISLMTSNTLFYTTMEADITAIYGEGLLEPSPLAEKLRKTSERLAKLREALEREIDTDGKERIKKAISAHISILSQCTGGQALSDD